MRRCESLPDADLHAEHPIGKVAALLREHCATLGWLFSTAADRTLSRAIAVADGRGAIAVEEVAAGEATEAYAALPARRGCTS